MVTKAKGGRCKWYIVAGQSVQGTWERNIAQVFEQKKIKWEKLRTNQHVFNYTMEGKERCYSPDFWLPEYNKYVEIKGYWWGNDKAKMLTVIQQYPNVTILVIEKAQYDILLRGDISLLGSLT